MVRSRFAFGCLALCIAIRTVLAAGAVGPGQWNSHARKSERVDPQVAVLQIRPDIYVLTVDGVNVVLETGPDGSVLVDSGPEASAPALLAKIRDVIAGPIRLIVNTSGDPELITGNVILAPAGLSWVGQPGHSAAVEGGAKDANVGVYAAIVAHQNVLTRMVAENAPDQPQWLMPNEVFSRQRYSFYINGQNVSVIWQPAAHTDGDAVVQFQQSDVVAAGALFDMTRFPVIDVSHGGSIQGEIDGLNQLINALVFTPVPVLDDGAGTLVVPIRGPVSTQADLVTYRDMLIAVRDRVQALIGQGLSLKDIQAMDTTQGYNTRFGANTGNWTTPQFVEAVYIGLTANAKASTAKSEGEQQ
jgi:cyclase